MVDAIYRAIRNSPQLLPLRKSASALRKPQKLNSQIEGVHVSLSPSDSRPNAVIAFQSERVAQTRITWWECNSSTLQFRTIGGCSRQTRPCIVFLTFNSLPPNPSLSGSVASDPQQPTRARLPSMRPLLPQLMRRPSQHQRPPFHQTFRPPHRPQPSPQALPQPKSSPHLSIQVLMGSRSILYRPRLLKHERKRTTTPHTLSTRASAV